MTALILASRWHPFPRSKGRISATAQVVVVSLLLLLLLLLSRTASENSLPVDALLSPLILFEGPAADVSIVAPLFTDASGAVVSGKTRVAVVISTKGASAASATFVGTDCSGPSNRGNIGLSTVSDFDLFSCLFASSNLAFSTSVSLLMVFFQLSKPQPPPIQT